MGKKKIPKTFQELKDIAKKAIGGVGPGYGKGLVDDPDFIRNQKQINDHMNDAARNGVYGLAGDAGLGRSITGTEAMMEKERAHARMMQARVYGKFMDQPQRPGERLHVEPHLEEMVRALFVPSDSKAGKLEFRYERVFENLIKTQENIMKENEALRKKIDELKTNQTSSMDEFFEQWRLKVLKNA